MAKDPAFLFYPGDWLGGTMLITRHHKGCYMDLLMAQFNNGPLSLDQIKAVLGQDQAAWTVLQEKFTVDNSGRFFNKKLAAEIEKRKAFTASRRNNLEGKKDKISHMEDHINNHTDNRMENENENEKEDLDLNLKSVKEKKEVFGLSKNVRLTKLEFQRLEIDLGNQLLGECIEFLSSYRAEKGYKSKEDNLSIRRWVITAVSEAKQKIQKINGNGEKFSKNQSIRNSAEEAKRLIREDIANANGQGEDSN